MQLGPEMLGVIANVKVTGCDSKETLWYSLQEGSRLKVDYEVTWDRDNFFRSPQQKPSQTQFRERERGRERQRGSAHAQMENSRKSHWLHADLDNARRKRFKVHNMRIWNYDRLVYDSSIRKYLNKQNF